MPGRNPHWMKDQRGRPTGGTRSVLTSLMDQRRRIPGRGLPDGLYGLPRTVEAQPRRKLPEHGAETATTDPARHPQRRAGTSNSLALQSRWVAAPNEVPGPQQARNSPLVYAESRPLTEAARTWRPAQAGISLPRSVPLGHLPVRIGHRQLAARLCFVASSFILQEVSPIHIRHRSCFLNIPDLS